MDAKLSIVIPVFNSEKSLERLCQTIQQEFSTSDYEIVFVDDASKDSSWEILKQIKSKNDTTIKIIQLENNIGQHRATLVGLKYCSGEMIITLDDDLQHSPSDIKRILEQHIHQKNDVTYGVYFDNKKHTLFRNLASAYIKLTSSFFSTHKNSKGSSFRVLTKQIAQKLVKHVNEFVYIEEAIHKYTRKIGFVEITHLKRKDGVSSYSLFGLLGLYSNILTAYYIKRMKKSLLIIVPISMLLILLSIITLTTFSIQWQLRWSLFLLVLLPLFLYYLFWVSLFIYCLVINRTKLNETIIPYKIKINV